MARGFLPDEHRTVMVGGRQVPVSKWPKKGVRPLLVGSAWRRLLARGLLGERKREVLDFFQANSRVQQFVSAEDGLPTASTWLQRWSVRCVKKGPAQMWMRMRRGLDALALLRWTFKTHSTL